MMLEQTDFDLLGFGVALPGGWGCFGVCLVMHTDTVLRERERERERREREKRGGKNTKEAV